MRIGRVLRAVLLSVGGCPLDVPCFMSRIMRDASSVTGPRQREMQNGNCRTGPAERDLQTGNCKTGPAERELQNWMCCCADVETHMLLR